LGKIHRPVAQAFFWAGTKKLWTEVWMLVDSGADYTLLPRYLADRLQVNLEKECKIFNTFGVGGGERVYFLPKIKVKLGKWERIIPAGFLERNEIPPLLGRHLFMETFETIFSPKHFVTFNS
jgi:predicted aspartyl protease